MRSAALFVLIIGTFFALFLTAACTAVHDDSDPYDGYSASDPGVMTLVPGSNFLMGSPSDPLWEDFPDFDDAGFFDEHPVHEVFLSPFYIDLTEVANAQYRACVLDGGCADPLYPSSLTREDYYVDPSYANYPVVNVSYIQAADYCRWAGKRLPTEAEWEKAARGSVDARQFPWGDAAPDCKMANIAVTVGANGGDRIMTQPCVGDTLPAGSFPNYKSPYGALDMTGNAAEWVADWYDPAYYDPQANPGNAENPAGPAEGTLRVVRGGSFASISYFARTSFRQAEFPDAILSDVGFRCAKDY